MVFFPCFVFVAVAVDAIVFPVNGALAATVVNIYALSFVAVNVAVIVRPVELLISNFRLCTF